MNLHDALEEYLTINYQYEPKTKKIYRTHVGRLSASLNNPPLEQITPLQIGKFMGQLKKKNGRPYSPGYLNQMYRTLKAFFNFCVDEEWLPKNPMSRLKPPPVSAGPKPRLSLNQVRQLLDEVKKTEASERNLAIILLMVDCGLRVGEVVQLTAIDLHLDEETITVYASKTHTSREVPLTNSAAQALQNYLRIRPPFNKNSDPVFLMAKGKQKNHPINRDAVCRLMTRLRKKLGFPLHAHLLRHTFANHFNRKGNLRYLQKILGHSRIDTTARYYTDPDMQDMLAQIRQAAPTAQIYK